jgi:CIC family chloride channel protein
MTVASYACGAPGGIFVPLLVLGSEIGLGIGFLAEYLIPGTIEHPETFAAVGMAAYFAAIVQAPITAVVLTVEMTGSYSLILPSLVACFVSYRLAELLGDRPVYEALRERQPREQLPDAREGVTPIL